MHRVILPAADLLPNPQLRPFRCVQSRAVLRLASAAADRGKAKENGRLAEVEPMIVEGPRGTSLRALGSKEDHKVIDMYQMFVLVAWVKILSGRVFPDAGCRRRLIARDSTAAGPKGMRWARAIRFSTTTHAVTLQAATARS